MNYEQVLQVLGPLAEAPWFEITNADNGKDGSSKIPIVRINGPIGGFAAMFGYGVGHAQFAEKLDAIDADEIDLRINSGGGSVFEADGIAASLRKHPAKVVATIEGLAASAASTIAMAADEVVMDVDAEMMIHNASGGTWGGATELRKFAAILERQNTKSAKAYMRKAGGKLDDWFDAMDEETWYFADEAVEAGLADRISGDKSESDTGSTSEAVAIAQQIFGYRGRRDTMDNDPGQIPAAAAPAAAAPQDDADAINTAARRQRAQILMERNR